MRHYVVRRVTPPTPPPPNPAMQKGPMMPLQQRQRERGESKRLNRLNNNSTLVVQNFFCSILPSQRANSDVRMPSFTFDRGLEQAITILFSLSELRFCSEGINSRRDCFSYRLHLAKWASWNDRDDRKNSNSLFKRRFLFFHCTFLFVNSEYGSGVRPDRSLMKNC